MELAQDCTMADSCISSAELSGFDTKELGNYYCISYHSLDVLGTITTLNYPCKHSM
jgi:hypothetical protein